MIKKRLLDICNALGISESEFCTTIGMSRSYTANLKGDITTRVLMNIHIKYPEVNIMRIITGEGDVLQPVNDDEALSSGSSDTLLSSPEGLQNELRHLYELLNEKERTIRILMDKTGK